MVALFKIGIVIALNPFDQFVRWLISVRFRLKLAISGKRDVVDKGFYVRFPAVGFAITFNQYFRVGW